MGARGASGRSGNDSAGPAKVRAIELEQELELGVSLVASVIAEGTRRMSSTAVEGDTSVVWGAIAGPGMEAVDDDADDSSAWCCGPDRVVWREPVPTLANVVPSSEALASCGVGCCCWDGMGRSTGAAMVWWVSIEAGALAARLERGRVRNDKDEGDTSMVLRESGEERTPRPASARLAEEREACMPR